MTTGSVTHHMGSSGLAPTYSKEEIRNAIWTAEKVMESSPNRIELNEPEHMFVPGLYFRKFTMEAGTLLTGKLHAQDDGLILAAGKADFLTENGMTSLEGPVMVTVRANTKPVVYAHTHCTWFSAHRNDDDTRDLSVIESRVILDNTIECNERGVLQ